MRCRNTEKALAAGMRAHMDATGEIRAARKGSDRSSNATLP